MATEEPTAMSIDAQKQAMSAHKMMAWLSPSYPIGAFSFSHGLEQAIDCGLVRDPDSLLCWVSDVVTFGAGRNDAILLAQAYMAQTPQDIEEISAFAKALCSSSERLLETTAQGDAFAKVTSAVYSDVAKMALPVAVGQAAVQEQIPLDQVLPLYLHSFAANLIAVGVRFVPIGQTDGQQILMRLFDVFEEVAHQALTSTLDDIGGISVMGDISAMKHETMTTRIFRT